LVSTLFFRLTSLGYNSSLVKWITSGVQILAGVLHISVLWSVYLVASVVVTRNMIGGA